MLKLGEGLQRDCGGVTRREVLRVAGIEALGLSLAGWFARKASAAGQPEYAATASDVACIFIWLNGGPSHFETFDPKPDAPDSVRGPYGAIATDVPGVHLCELLPMLAARAGRYAIIRSLTHNNNDHASTAMLTGFEAGTAGYGSILTRLKGHARSMPPFVHIGSRRGDGTLENSNIDRVGGGELGAAFEPVVVRDPTGKQVELPDLSLSADVSADRFLERRKLLSAVDQWRARTESNPAIGEMHDHYRRAIEMLTSSRVREAFDLRRESEPLRTRYGANFFGQACLMARRLIEAGTRYVQVKWYDAIAFDAWDVHGAELPGMSRMEQQLCPRFDQGFSALLDDLDERGLLDSTLVVVAGEFGRTPQINKFGARDHWAHCFSAVVAGAGVPGGTVVGASDAQGAFPAERPVKPEEFAATLYQRLGIDLTRDLRIRPFLRDALPVSELV
jgi:hypothetical protein